MRIKSLYLLMIVCDQPEEQRLNICNPETITLDLKFQPFCSGQGLDMLENTGRGNDLARNDKRIKSDFKAV